MKTKFKDVAHHYLGTGLQVTYTDTFGETAVGTLDGVDTRYQRVHIDGCVTYECKPHLRNLSSLTQEIEVNGERFVPMEILFNSGMPTVKCWEDSKYYRLMCGNERVPIFYNISKDMSILKMWELQQLLAWHFNCFGLSEDEFIAITH